jgi:sulfur carrier protein
MRVLVNGDPRELPDRATVADVVVASGASPEGRGVAVAIDGEVVPRRDWNEPVRPDQRIEVLQAVQGG